MRKWLKEKERWPLWTSPPEAEDQRMVLVNLTLICWLNWLPGCKKQATLMRVWEEIWIRSKRYTYLSYSYIVINILFLDYHSVSILECLKRSSRLTNSGPGNKGNCILESLILNISPESMPLEPPRSSCLWHEWCKSASWTSASGISNCYWKPGAFG